MSRDQLGGDVEGLGDGFPVNRATVGLDVGGLEQVTLEGLLAAQAGLFLEAVLDGVSLLGQVGDLGQESTEGVDAVGGDCCSHDSLSFAVTALHYCLVSKGSVTQNYRQSMVGTIIF